MEGRKNAMLERKYDALRKRYDRLNEKYSELTNEKAHIENALKTANEKLESVAQLEAEFREAIAHAKDIQEKYEAALEDVKLLRKDYGAKVKKLIREIR